MEKTKPDDQYCKEVLTGKVDIETVLETEDSLAFNARWPAWETHIIVIPKKHIESVTSFSDMEDEEVANLLRDVANVAKIVEETNGQCRILTNVGDYQHTKHLHWHIYSGEELVQDEV